MVSEANGTRPISPVEERGVVVPLRRLPADPHFVVSVLRREVRHETIETARALGLANLGTSTVIEVLVARGWLPPEAVEHALLLERRLHADTRALNRVQAEALEELADEAIGWLRCARNRTVGG